VQLKQLPNHFKFHEFMRKITLLLLLFIASLSVPQATFAQQSSKVRAYTVQAKASKKAMNVGSQRSFLPPTTVEAGFAVNTLATMPEQMAGMAIDDATGTIYLASQNTASALYSVTPAGTVTLLNSDWSSMGPFYPFVATDVEFANGFFYSQLDVNTLREVDAATGTVTGSYTGANSGIEAGIAVIGNNLYSTDGSIGTELYVRDLTTYVATLSPIALPNPGNETLESTSNPNELIYCGNGNFHRVDLLAGTVSPVIATMTSAQSHFAVTPDGLFAYYFDQTAGIIRKVDLSSGAVSDFVTGITGAQFNDLEFGPATSGSNISLYFTDSANLYEITGVFVGTAPTIACPPDNMSNTNPGECSAIVNFTDAVAIDAEDGPISVTQTMGPVSGSAFPTGDTIIEFTATDSDGNSTSCQFTVTVVDNEAPVAVCQDLTVTLDSVTGMASITPADIDNGSTDNCGIVTYSLDQDTFDCSNTGDNTVTLTVTDAEGNSSSCTATVTVEDTTAPVITCIGAPSIFSETEDFEAASIPAGWSTMIVSGTVDWTFGTAAMPTSLPMRRSLMTMQPVVQN